MWTTSVTHQNIRVALGLHRYNPGEPCHQGQGRGGVEGGRGMAGVRQGCGKGEGGRVMTDRPLICVRAHGISRGGM